MSRLLLTCQSKLRKLRVTSESLWTFTFVSFTDFTSSGIVPCKSRYEEGFVRDGRFRTAMMPCVSLPKIFDYFLKGELARKCLESCEKQHRFCDNSSPHTHIRFTILFSNKCQDTRVLGEYKINVPWLQAERNVFCFRNQFYNRLVNQNCCS